MEESVTTPTAKPNPLLQRIQLPGETFTLPSGGIFYTHGELRDDVKNAEIHVHPMTTLDEITIKTPDLLFSGQAVKQVFARCIPQVTKVDQLLAKDIDFLMICLRKVSYGEELRIDFKHDCEGANTHKYTIDVSQFIRNAKKIDPTTVARQFSVKMPNDQVVLLQPIRFKEFIRVMQANEIDESMDPERVRDVMVESMSSLIIRVDEVEDQEQIIEWLKQVPPSFVSVINDHIDSTLEWGPEFRSKSVCKDCGKEIEIVAPMNPLAFFT